jgi:hypothetical protein
MALPPTRFSSAVTLLRAIHQSSPGPSFKIAPFQGIYVNIHSHSVDCLFPSPSLLLSQFQLSAASASSYSFDPIRHSRRLLSSSLLSATSVGYSTLTLHPPLSSATLLLPFVRHFRRLVFFYPLSATSVGYSTLTLYPPLPSASLLLPFIRHFRRLLSSYPKSATSVGYSPLTLYPPLPSATLLLPFIRHFRRLLYSYPLSPWTARFIFTSNCHWIPPARCSSREPPSKSALIRAFLRSCPLQDLSVTSPSLYLFSFSLHSH